MRTHIAELGSPQQAWASPDASSVAIHNHHASAGHLQQQQHLQQQLTDCPGSFWLPSRDQTAELVDKFLGDLNHVRHLVHDASLRRLVADVFDSRPHVPAGPVVVLSSVFSLVASTWTADDPAKVQSIASAAEAQARTEFWTRIAYEVSERCQANGEASLDILQGLAILCFTILNLEGLTLRALQGLSRTVTLARHLGLHRIDDPREEASPAVRLTGISAEVARRIWWHLSAVDWYVILQNILPPLLSHPLFAKSAQGIANLETTR